MYNRRKVTVVIVALILVVATIAPALFVNRIQAQPSPPWWNPAWPFRKTITVDHTKVAGNLTNFPVLISITDSDLASKAQANGNDIVFTDANGVKLNHEIESFNATSGNLVAWVCANLSSEEDTVLYMYYGNPSASNQQNPTAVWDSNYVMVQHMDLQNTTIQQWQQYSGNPILNGSTDGFASVFYDNSTGLYNLFCSWNSILHFTSSNGINNWVADPNNPVLSGNSEGVPMVWKENGTWYMLYRYYTSGTSSYVIGLATSTDASHWTEYSGNPVLTGTSGQWDDPSYSLDPWGVIKVGSTYYLWYSTIGGERDVGLATSTNLYNWTKDPNNPIFTVGRFCAFPFTYGGVYYMLVGHYNPSNSAYGNIELYSSPNPTFYSTNRTYVGLVISPGSAGSWTQYRFDTPFVLTDTIYRNTYSASNNSLWMYFASTPDSGTSWWTGMCIEQNITDALTRLGETVYSNLDSTANQNNGTAGGQPTSVTGQIDGATHFNAADPDYINCGSSSSLAGMSALTVEAWVKQDNLPSGGTGIVAKWSSWSSGSYILWQGSSGAVSWGVITTNTHTYVTGPAALTAGQWYYLVGVYNGSQITLYINGAQVGSASLTGNVMSTSDLCYIGRYTTPYFNGTIDEVRISNMSRSVSWITTEYNNELNPSTFCTVGSEEAQVYTLTVSVNPSAGGSVSADVEPPYYYGDVVTLTETPSAGYTFSSWGGDGSGTATTCVITMNSNKTVTATFTENTYMLTVNTVGSGVVQLNYAGPYYYGTSVQLTALPTSGWGFDHWEGDLAGSANPATLTFTGNMQVTAYFVLPQLYVDPSSIQKGPGDTYTTFQTSVMVNEITDLKGFDFNLTWDNNLIALVSEDYTTALNNVWGSGNWYLAYNATGAGYYDLAALSTLNSFNSTAATPLATFTFIVEAAVGQTSIHFALVELSNSEAGSIQAQVTDGNYQITGPQYQPILQMTPGNVICSEYGESFTVQVNVTNAITMDGFNFAIYYSPALMSYVGVSWGQLGSGTITNVDQTNGIIEGNVAGTAISGNTWLLNITFQDTAMLIWTKGQTNELDGQIWFNNASLDFSGVQQLACQQGGLSQISVNNVAFKFVPIQGDINNDGVVNIIDLRTVAAYFDVKAGDPLWSVASNYDLNGDGVIDIYDIVLVAANFGYTYP